MGQLRRYLVEQLSGGPGIVYPFLHLLPSQHQRHPVMDLRHGAIGRRGEDHTPALACIVVPKPRQIEGPIRARQLEPILPLLPAPMSPLIKACGGKYAPPPQNRLTEHGPLQGGLTAGVDDGPAFSAHPRITPHHNLGSQLRPCLHQHRHRIGREDLSGFELVLHLPQDIHDLLALLGGQAVSAAHSTHLTALLYHQIAKTYSWIFGSVSHYTDTRTSVRGMMRWSG